MGVLGEGRSKLVLRCTNVLVEQGSSRMKHRCRSTRPVHDRLFQEILDTVFEVDPSDATSTSETSLDSRQVHTHPSSHPSQLDARAGVYTLHGNVSTGIV